MTSPGHSPVNLAVDQWKLYDLAVREWVLRLGPLLNVPTFNVIFATPDRAFATLTHLLNKRYGERAEKIKTPPFPIASISRLSHRFDRSRFLPNSRRIRGQRYTTDRRVAYDALFPLPWDMPYQIDFWAKTREVMNVFSMWLQGESTPQGALCVDLKNVDAAWGQKIVLFDVEEITDTSQLEPEEENRSLRFTVTLTLHGWLLLPLVPNKTVFSVLADMYQADPGTTIADIESNPATYPLLDTSIVIDSGS